jgi:hypothetical protein
MASPLRPLVHSRGLLGFRMKPFGRPVNLHSDHYPVGGHIQFNVANTPRGLQSENVAVKFGARHRHKLDNSADFHKNSH